MALLITALQAITLGLAVGVAYFICKARPVWWLLIVGFFVAFIFGWMGGVIAWGFMFMYDDPYSAITYGMPKSFWIALAGAGYGVFLGRRKSLQNFKKMPV